MQSDTAFSQERRLRPLFRMVMVACACMCMVACACMCMSRKLVSAVNGSVEPDGQHNYLSDVARQPPGRGAYPFHDVGGVAGGAASGHVAKVAHAINHDLCAPRAEKHTSQQGTLSRGMGGGGGGEEALVNAAYRSTLGAQRLGSSHQVFKCTYLLNTLTPPVACLPPLVSGKERRRPRAGGRCMPRPPASALALARRTLHT